MMLISDINATTRPAPTATPLIAEITGRREGAAGAGHHRDARGVVGVQGEPHLGELPVQPVIGGVEHFRPVDRDENDPVGSALEHQVLVVAVIHGGVSPPQKWVRREASMSRGGAASRSSWSAVARSRRPRALRLCVPLTL